jgi:hypothetical protein
LGLDNCLKTIEVSGDESSDLKLYGDYQFHVNDGRSKRKRRERPTKCLKNKWPSEKPTMQERVKIKDHGSVVQAGQDNGVDKDNVTQIDNEHVELPGILFEISFTLDSDFESDGDDVECHTAHLR